MLLYHSEIDSVEICVTSKEFRIKEIIGYINENIEYPVTLKELASHFYLSTPYMCRLFKSATGTTIHQYISECRIIHAKKLLLAGYSAADTCARCGFNEYSNFYKSFTRSVGVSPSRFINHNHR